jgi:FkbM family methyltransferase
MGQEALLLAVKRPPSWDWNTFEGSQPALKYARRDLPTVDRALGLCTGRRCCVQAGGCLGIFPKYLARYFRTVHTFEPSADLFSRLCKNAPEKNIKRHLAALGMTHEMIGTSQTRRGSKGHRYPHEGITHISGAGPVPTRLVDDLELPHCEFLCLDLEGFELFALIGARHTIERCWPVIMVEINENIEFYGHVGDDVRQFLSNLGYERIFRMHSDEVYVPGARRES